MTAADSVYCELHSIFDSGNVAEVRRVITEFYRRTDPCMEIIGFSDKDREVLLENYDRRKQAVTTSRLRYDLEWNSFWLDGVKVSDAKLAELLGVPVAFLEGVITGFWKSSLKGRPIASRLPTLESKTKDAGLDYGKVIRKIEKKVAQDIRDRVVRRQRAEMTEAIRRKVREIAACHNMPQPPEPEWTWDEVSSMKPFSGLYFAYDKDNSPAYVGKSKNVPKRLLGHHALTKDDRFGVLGMRCQEIGRAELFYIWLLNPSRNGGIH